MSPADSTDDRDVNLRTDQIVDDFFLVEEIHHLSALTQLASAAAQNGVHPLVRTALLKELQRQVELALYCDSQWTRLCNQLAEASR